MSVTHRFRIASMRPALMAPGYVQMHCYTERPPSDKVFSIGGPSILIDVPHDFAKDLRYGQEIEITVEAK